MSNLSEEIAFEMNLDREREEAIINAPIIQEKDPDFVIEPQNLIVKIFGECLMEDRLKQLA